MSDVSPSLLTWLEQCTAKNVTHSALLQMLWSGYGECFRAWLDGNTTPVVVKAVVPPTYSRHPRGWNGDAGHRRKLRSFDIEHRFYTHYQPQLTSGSYAPRLLAEDKRGDAVLLVLDDLQAHGYVTQPSSLSVTQCQPVLHWLAHFHARFLNEAFTGLWQQGCYWHLATRQDEWRAMADGPLKSHAAALDDMLQQARFKTLLHGDAKLANFCFTADGTRAAAIDFQYTGSGPGIRDVAYFLGSALSDDDLLTATDTCLDMYFDELACALRSCISVTTLTDLESEWRALYPVACADFHRFLAGWSPDHRKINEALRRQTADALVKIKG
ncbi:phosphotransferase [Alteromonas halophila]|uniref:Phosphotransferase n=1 Tax=Alteromonas halophila TaxID=516698 RepID=A0A918JEF7_9ALTE|nr:phosphotransferase [Alteromonas halophila]GGW76793.1 phosphotransferase [Alteromonas halophila]